MIWQILSDTLNQKNLDEAMNKKEVLFKRNVLNYLREDGFPTFADYLGNFHFNFLTSADAGKPFVAAVSVQDGVVLVNPNLEADAISMILRHEAGHIIFKHMDHLFAKLKAMGINNPSELAYRLSNKVGDYHISNELYDASDYYVAKHIKIEGPEEFEGLVTELDFPENSEYWKMDFDQLWDEFVKDYDKDSLDADAIADLSDEFAAGWNDLVDKYNAGEITDEDIMAWAATNEAINKIINPYEGEKAEGFNAALVAIAAALSGQGSGGGPASPNPKLKTPKIKSQASSQQSDGSEPQDQNQQSNQKQKDQGQKSTQGSDKSSTTEPQEMKDLMKKAQDVRDSSQDVIDDDGNKIGDESSGSSSGSKGSDTSANKTGKAARLDKISKYWDPDQGNQDRLDLDKKSRHTYERIRREIQAARLSSAKRNYSYKPLTINEIVADIVHTLKTQEAPQRVSSWSRYNDRATQLGYVAPGRYTQKAANKIPNIGFYFDISGSWCGDKEKIDMGHRIEEGLKELEKRKKIVLTRFYFGTKVHTQFTTNDQGNSDAPIPHALKMLEAGELDNVIIMTDADPECNLKLQVPGCAWLLFYDAVSESLARNVSGKKRTSIYTIKH